MKKIMNDPKHIVLEMLEGLVKTRDYLSLDRDSRTVYRKNDGKRVSIISGGGSGHEPAHAGYVRNGMLDAAVSGNVFASPDPMSILKAIELVNSEEGVLLVVKNYSGDVMNFEMAAELAADQGLKVETVIVNDDVSIKETDKRRGIAGTVLIHRIAGSAAARGYDLENVKRIAQESINSLRSFGVSLSSCILPEIGKPIFELAEDEIELGMGIHGEEGVQRTKLLSSKELAVEMFNRVTSDSVNYQNEEVIVVINGLGSTPLMELYVLANDVFNLCVENEIKIIKFLVGNYMTSLEMAGASLTMLKVNSEISELLKSMDTEPLD